MPRKTKHIPWTEILQRLAHGMPLQEMADDFGLTTVGQMRHRTRHLYAKLGARDPAHAVQIAHNNGMLGKCAKNCRLCEREKERVEGL